MSVYNFAVVNLVRIKSASGEQNEVETLVRMGIQTANSNLGIKQIRTLMGRTVLGIILTRQSWVDKAKSILLAGM